MQSPPFFIVLTAKSQPVQSAQTDMLYIAVPWSYVLRIRLQLGSKPLMTCPPPRANSLTQNVLCKMSQYSAALIVISAAVLQCCSAAVLQCCRLCMAVLEQKHSRSSMIILDLYLQLET